MGHLAGTIGAETRFKVDSIKTLQWLLDHTAPGPPSPAITRQQHVLQGISGDGTHCVSFFHDEFAVIDGLGLVEEDRGLDLRDLGTNETHEGFLLGLHWRAPFGWPTEMHVLGVAAYDGVEEVA